MFKKHIVLWFSLILGLIPLLWYLGRGNVLIDGIDTNFPLNPVIWFSRRLYVWNSVGNAGTDFSTSTAGILFHLLQVIPSILGFKLQLVQIASVLFWFLLLTFSSMAFVRVILPGKRVPQLLFIIFYSVNIYLFNTWENIKVANLSLVSAIPLSLSILILMKDKKIPYSLGFLLSAVVGIIASGTGINPAYFVSFLFSVFVFEAGVILAEFSVASLKIRIKEFLVFLAAVLLVNSFWIFPSVDFIFREISPQGSIGQIGFTNWVDSLSENTSLINVMRLQGLWDWYATDAASGLPLYIPYSLNYFRNPFFIVFSLSIFGFALLSLIFREKGKKSLYVSFSLMMLLGIFLGAGTHAPTGIIYRWFLEHAPFFSLFRSPWYIFTPLLTLSYAGLLGLLFYSLDNRFEKLIIARKSLVILSLILIAGNLVYSYPLITGKIFRPGRTDGFYVNFPDYVFAAANFLNSEKSGRVIGYPDDEIEQFSWGYRGIESVLSLASSKETLFAPLNDPNSKVALVVKEFYSALKKNESEAVKNLASILDVDYLFAKNDQSSLALPLPSLKKSVTETAFGNWSFYRLQTQDSSKIRAVTNSYFGYPYSKGAKILSVLKPGEILLNPEDTTVGRIKEISTYSGDIILSTNSQLDEFKNFSLSSSIVNSVQTSRDLSSAIFGFKIPTNEFYTPVLERYELETFGIDPTKNLSVQIDGKNEVLVVENTSDSFVYYAKVKLAEGEHELSVKLINPNLIPSGNFESKGSFEKVGDAEFNLLSDSTEYLDIFNKSAQDAFVNFNISDFDPLFPYLVEFRYRQVYGNNATVLVKQDKETTLIKTQAERPPDYPEWSNFSFYYDPVITPSRLGISLISPQTKDPMGTKVLYDDLRVHKVFTNNLFFIREGQPVSEDPTVVFQKKSPVLYEGEVSKVSGPHILVFSENYSPEWSLEITGYKGNAKNIALSHFSSNLFANSWYVDGAGNDYKFKIYYQRQNLFYVGAFISIFSLSGGLVAYLVLKNRRK